VPDPDPTNRTGIDTEGVRAMHIPGSSRYHYFIEGKPACYGQHFSSEKREEWEVLDLVDGAEEYDLCGTCKRCFDPNHGLTTRQMRKRVADQVGADYDLSSAHFSPEAVQRLYEVMCQ
jgi:hypothetical protein